MDFIEFAKNVETQAIELYEKLATEVSIPELAGIFRFLAAEEHRHHKIFDTWQVLIETPADNSTVVLGEPKELLKKFSKAFGTLEAPPMNNSDAYRKALGFEQEGLKAYKEALLTLEDPEDRRQLEVIIGQENIHVELLNALLDFSRRPSE